MKIIQAFSMSCLVFVMFMIMFLMLRACFVMKDWQFKGESFPPVAFHPYKNKGHLQRRLRSLRNKTESTTPSTTKQQQNNNNNNKKLQDKNHRASKSKPVDSLEATSSVCHASLSVDCVYDSV